MSLLSAIRDEPASLQAGYMPQLVAGFSFVPGMSPVAERKNFRG
ncbi:hypothetical protein [Polaromonas hydrogenivorans]|uniref:Uncharacterized protein n=1 Tax=Polaromonas hydrogenivorans TaxID=335476 RepID=A0AAU7LTD9_9BURK